MLPNGHRTVMIKGEQFKFSCAHFVSYPGFRERLHGHNYTVEVEVSGCMSEQDGYVIDFGVLKKHIRDLCKSLNERILVPERSSTMQIREVQNATQEGAIGQLSSCGSGEVDEIYQNTGQIEIVCQSAFFSFPKFDCALLPIRFSTAEELSQYLALELQAVLRNDFDTREIDTMTVRVFERPTQAASFTLSFKSNLIGIMLCYSIDDESRREIELKLRQSGSQLVSTNWQCWIQYYYQAIFPKNSSETMAQLPLFSVVSIGQEGAFVMTEVEELRRAGEENRSFTYPMAVCDVTPMNKRQKRIGFNFKIFRNKNQDVYLADNLVIFRHGLSKELLPEFVIRAEEHSTRFMRSLDVELGFKRPKTHTDEQRIAFWVYTYSKLKDGVTIPPIRLPIDPVKFSQCVFAKNLRLV